MTLHTWLLYILTVCVISAIPGPNMLLVMSHGARHGLRRSTATMAGCLCALLLMMGVSAAGLGVFLKAWPTLFDALRLAGAAYLVWLGVRTWRSARHAGDASTDESPADGHAAAEPAVAPFAFGPRNRWALFRNGFAVASSNPKAILFAAALLPQFIDPTARALPQFGALLGSFAVIELSWYMVYAGSGAQLGRWLRRAGVARAFARVTGTLFVGFGAAMALLHE
ncbi:LysE family translocator [Thiomonas sp.]|uniref:LysE family translocator n=1 Tax=Thiomonas sp. TaxID=2047785 RepID=UPI002611848F|nr:LysE family translocator [Thiomonas sp.]